MVKAAPALLGLLACHGGHTNHVLSQDGRGDRIMTVLEGRSSYPSKHLYARVPSPIVLHPYFVLQYLISKY